MSSERPTVLLGIGGSIAAYKACDLIRLLREEGLRVIPVMTSSATKFVTPLTIGVLAGEPVYADFFEPQHNEGVDHIGLVRDAALYVVAPATANLITKLATGLADDYPSLVGVAFPRPWVIAPAMNTRMLENPVIQEHLETLRARGARIVAPAEGLLACGDVGAGKLAPLEAIRDAVLASLATGASLAGQKILITAGGTREAVDAVRYLGNRSSGKMGQELARTAAWRGAEVTLVTTVEPGALPPTVAVIRVESAAEMGTVLAERAPAQDIIVMAAAVADYTLEAVDGKLHREATGALTLHLTPSRDLLAELVATKSTGQLIVGFAAEVENLAERAPSKLQRKGCDVLIANDVSQPGIGFGADDNAVTMLFADQPAATVELPRASKQSIADQIWSQLLTHQRRRQSAHSDDRGALRHAAS